LESEFENAKINSCNSNKPPSLFVPHLKIHNMLSKHFSTRLFSKLATEENAVFRNNELVQH